jgi:hypothetical protein
MAETADVFVTAAGVGFAEFAGAVAHALGYVPAELGPDDVDVTLPSDGDRPELSLIDSSRGPGEYSMLVWAADSKQAEAGAAAVFDALVAATPWGIETEPEDGSPARSRPPLRTTA